jgi:hypothetical protein
MMLLPAVPAEESRIESSFFLFRIKKLTIERDAAAGGFSKSRVEAPGTAKELMCSSSAQVGQFEAIEEERVFGSSLTAEGAGDEIENRYAVGRGGEGGTRYKTGDPAALFG